MRWQVYAMRTIEYLVLSSHKTATQTVRRSLERSGRTVLHLHTLKQPGCPIAPGTLDRFAAQAGPGGQRLQIISVFREPVARLASSMFQWLGVGAIRTGEVASRQETLVHSLTLEQLRDYFIDEYVGSWGADEAIPEIAEELGIGVESLDFDAGRGLGTFRAAHCDVHLLRFDQFVRQPAAALTAIAGAEVSARATNQASETWYAEKYRQFVQELVLPRPLVERIYDERRVLVDLFHPEGYKAALAGALSRFSAS